MFDRNGKALSTPTWGSPAQHSTQQRRVSAQPSVSGLLNGTDPEDIIDLLTPVLALIGAAGMTAADREEWLIAAADALKDIPSDLLSSAISECRKRVDHPSKVIPFITEQVKHSLGSRKRLEEWAREDESRRNALPAPGKTYCTGEEAAEIIDRVFPQARQERAAPVKRHDGPPRMPTRADYIALGVDPAVLDRIEQEKAA